MNEKAQVQQLFIYLSAILVIGFLVLFGFRMVNKIMEQQCEVQEQEFLTSLVRTLDRWERQGAVSDVQLPAPCKYQELCFVDPHVIGLDETEWRPDWMDYYTDSDNADHYFIYQNALDDTQYNVFLTIPGKETYPILYDERITTLVTDDNGDYINLPSFCVEARFDAFSFWVEGRGRSIFLYETPS